MSSAITMSRSTHCSLLAKADRSLACYDDDIGFPRHLESGRTNMHWVEFGVKVDMKHSRYPAVAETALTFPKLKACKVAVIIEHCHCRDPTEAILSIY